MQENLDKKIKNYSLIMGISYAIIASSWLFFYLIFYIIDFKIGNSMVKSTFFLYHFFISTIIISIMSYIIFVHSLKPFGRNDKNKNKKIDIILLSFLTFGFCGLILSLPMIYLWILLFKRIKGNCKSLNK